MIQVSASGKQMTFRLQSDITLGPLNIVAGSGDKPITQVSASGDERKFHPEDISSMTQLKMKEVAEAYPPPRRLQQSRPHPRRHQPAARQLMSKCC